MGLFDFLRRKSAPPPPAPEAKERVAFDDQGVTRTFVDGRTERVRWDELQTVLIVTTDEGPWSDDVFWMLVGADGRSGCAVPQGVEGSSELLERLQQLPGFDNAAVIQAMGSTENANFVCWRREGTSPSSESAA
jgi:hypothetical protein